MRNLKRKNADFLRGFMLGAGTFAFLTAWHNKDPKFRKLIIEALKEWRDIVKDAEEKSEPATTNTVSTVDKT